MMQDKSTKDIINYLKKNIPYVFIVYLIFAAVWGSWLVKDIVSFDAEGLFYKNDTSDWYNQWFRLGRWALVYMKKAFSVVTVNPYFSNTIIFLLFPLSTILWNYIIEIWSDKDNIVVKYVFSIMYIIHPVWALLFSYRMHMEVLSFGMLILPMALVLLTDWTQNSDKLTFVVALTLVVICFGSFQSFMILYGNAVIVYFYLKLEKHESKKEILKAFSRIIIFTVLAIIAWYITARLLCYMNNEPYGDKYGSDQFMWDDRTIKESMIAILNYIKDSMFGNGIIYTCIYGIVSMVFMIKSIVGIVQKKGYSILLFIVSLMIILVPFSLEFVTAGRVVARSQWSFVFSLSFMMASDILWIYDIMKGKMKKCLKVVTITATIFAVVSQVQITTRLLYTDVHTMETDLRSFQSIYDRALDEGAMPGYAIYFVGSDTLYKFQNNESMLEYEVVGFSYLEYCTLYGRKDIRDFKVPQAMRAYGFNVSIANDEQYEIAKTTGKDMPNWPEKGSVKVIPEKKLIIVKIG